MDWLKAIGGAVSEAFGLWRDERKAVHEYRLAKWQTRAAIETARAQADLDIERMQVDQAEKSWTDEFFILLHAAPLIMLFIPGLQDFAKMGFQNMAEVIPDWYLMFYGAGVSFAYGIRKWGFLDWLKRRRRTGEAG